MKHFKDRDMQQLLGRVLRAGTVTSVSVVIIGGIFFIVRHGHTVSDYGTFRGIPDFIKTPRGIINGVLALKGQAIIQLGIIFLIATPILRVIFSAIGFALEKDRLYVGISVLVLCIILASAISGHAG
jgi:uncharacterized membrane protein